MRLASVLAMLGSMRRHQGLVELLGVTAVLAMLLALREVAIVVGGSHAVAFLRGSILGLCAIIRDLIGRCGGGIFGKLLSWHLLWVEISGLVLLRVF